MQVTALILYHKSNHNLKTFSAYSCFLMYLLIQALIWETACWINCYK